MNSECLYMQTVLLRALVKTVRGEEHFYRDDDSYHNNSLIFSIRNSFYIIPTCDFLPPSSLKWFEMNNTPTL